MLTLRWKTYQFLIQHQLLLIGIFIILQIEILFRDCDSFHKKVTIVSVTLSKLLSRLSQVFSAQFEIIVKYLNHHNFSGELRHL